MNKIQRDIETIKNLLDDQAKTFRSHDLSDRSTFAKYDKQNMSINNKLDSILDMFHQHKEAHATEAQEMKPMYDAYKAAIKLGKWGMAVLVAAGVVIGIFTSLKK